MITEMTYSHLMAVAWEVKRMMVMAMMAAVVVVVVEGDILILFCSEFSLSLSVPSLVRQVSLSPLNWRRTAGSR